MTGAGTRLGVDLGTTWTAAALRRAGRVEAVELSTEAPAMPSVVAVDGDAGGERPAIIAGERAERQLLTDPTSGLREIKRRLGDTTPMVMAGKPYGPEALMGHLLRHVVAAATEANHATAPDEIVLTHPAVWGDYKLELLHEAGRQAGVGEITLMPEPVAAALHYVSLGRLAAGDVVAVYDFGGGTFDAAVVQCTEGGAEILGRPEGLERLGGVDLDQIVVLHVDQALDGRLRELDTTDPEGRRALARLRAECTAAKEALSHDTEVSIPVGLPGLHTEVRITRDELEAGARARIADTLGALDRAVAAAAVEPSALAGVLLVGGSSRMPVVAEEVGRRTGRPTLLDADPKLVVALGAAGGSTVMTPTRKTDPADATESTSDAATTPPPSSPPPPSGRPGAPGVPLSASAQADARAAALRAAANTGKPPKKDGRRAAAGVAAGVAGAAAAGYAAYELLDDDGKDGKDDEKFDETAQDEGLDAALAADGSMDAFDDIGGGGVFGGGGAERVVGGERAAARGGGSPDAEPELADISEAKAELRERFAAWEPPEGADPEEVAAFRAEIEALINRYQPRPGMSPNDALAELRQQFDDQVEDFVQDLKLDAVVEDRDRDDPPPEPGDEEPRWEWNAEKGRWEWDRGSEPKPAEPHWEWDPEEGRWEWDDGPDPLPPTREGFEWLPTHVDEHGATIPGHWERARARVAPGDEDRPGLDWVEAHVDEYGRHVPGHWETERPASVPDDEPPPEPPPDRTWVEGHYDEHGKYVKGHWEEGSADKPTPGSEDDDAPPPIIENPPMPPPTTPPVPPGDPSGDPTAEPEPGPYTPPVVRDHRGDGADEHPGGVDVRDHRGDDRGDRYGDDRYGDDGYGDDRYGGGPYGGDRGGPYGGDRGDDRYGGGPYGGDRGGNVRDHRSGSRLAADASDAAGPSGVLEQLEDVFDHALPGAQSLRQTMAREAAPADEAETEPTESAGPAPAEPAEPADDLLGVEAFADATATAPELELTAEIPPPPPEPAPAELAAPAPAPVPPPAPEPVAESVTIADAVPADAPTDFSEQSDLGPDPDDNGRDDATVSDLDNNTATPL